MYSDVDEVLEAAYKLYGVCIEPLNNTASVLAWLKGECCEHILSQHEWHANGAMLRGRIERVLNDVELAVIELKFTDGIKADGIVDLTAWIERENRGVNLLLCDDVLLNLFNPERYKAMAVMDKHDISCGAFYRQRDKVKKIVAALENSAYAKLQDEFEKCGLIRRYCA